MGPGNILVPDPVEVRLTRRPELLTAKERHVPHDAGGERRRMTMRSNDKGEELGVVVGDVFECMLR